MIVFHKSLKRSNEYIHSLKSMFDAKCLTIDGIIETFNNEIGQGFIIKIYKSFNKDEDLALWIYESLTDKNIQVAYSYLSNVDKNNNWINYNKVKIKTYPIKKLIKREVVAETYQTIIKYYGLDKEIEMPKSISI